MLGESKLLIDTNVLIYFLDKGDKKKHGSSKEILKLVFDAKIGVISTQNLAEFSANAYKKKFMRIGEINNALLDFAEVAQIIKYSENEVIRANTLSQQYKIPFFDALIVTTMQKERITRILTENEKDFKKIEWLEVINPFKKKESI